MLAEGGRFFDSTLKIQYVKQNKGIAMKKKLGLVICSGNIFRSPVAAFCLNRVLRQVSMDKDIEFTSRGIQGLAPTTLPKYRKLQYYPLEWKHSELAFREFGIDISTHESAVVTEEILEQAIIVLAMDSEILLNKPNSLINLFPHHSWKIRLYSQLVDESFGVEDIFGVDDGEFYRRVVSTIDGVSKRGIKFIEQWIKNT